MTAIRFTIPGPFTPERKRQVSQGQWTRRIDTSGAREFKAKVALIAQQYAPPELLDEPLRVAYRFYSVKPKSYRKHEGWPWKRPDIENLCKILSDGLTGIILKDDAAICLLHAYKLFGKRAEVKVTITLLEKDWPY